MHEVLVIGRSCLDLFAVVERFPAEDTKEPLVLRLMEGGGQGGTASCCIARLGGKAAYYGHLADDENGRFCLQRLQDFQVDTAHVKLIKGGQTPVAYIFVTRSSGKRTIIYEKNVLPALQGEVIAQMMAQGGHVILLDPEVTYLAPWLLSKTGKRPLIVYDCERWREGILAMMELADYFIPAGTFLASKELNFQGLSFREQFFNLAGIIGGRLVVTQGEQGAFYAEGDRLIQVTPPRVAVKDTTGAGDNFHAAFALAMARKMAFAAAVKFAVAVAALSCEAYGGREGIPGWQRAQETAAKLQERIVS